MHAASRDSAPQEEHPLADEHRYDIDPDKRIVHHESGELAYDTLIVATGVKQAYFGNDQWSEYAPGLKTVEHALRMRRRIFNAFETAELTSEAGEREPWLYFVVVGAGPTGLELAGAIAELAHRTMVENFRRFDPRETRILLVEGADKAVPGLAPAAIQQGEYVAQLLNRRRKGKTTPSFTMAGFNAGLLWMMIHIYALIGSTRRLRVMVQWV